jgi:hypothetical protein
MTLKCFLLLLTGTIRYAYCCALCALVIGAGSILTYFNLNPVLLNVVYIGSLLVIFFVNCCGVFVSPE